MTPDTPLLLVEQMDAVCLLTLQRPEKRNALNDMLIDALDDAVSRMPDDVRVIVIQGAGDHFCAGLDLAERLSRKDRTPLEGVRHSRHWHHVFERLQFGERPVVSVLRGSVIGGGLELAASTHVRVAERSTFYQLPEAQRGIFVGGGGSVRIPRIIGTGRMLEMMLTGRRYGAEEGLALGLSHYVVEPDAGLATALELATRIAGNSAVSNYAVINAIPRIGDMSISDGLFAEAMVGSLTRASGESSARIAAFLNSRGAHKAA